MRNPYDLTQEELKKQATSIDKRKWLVKIQGLDTAFDLAQIIKHYMIDMKRTYYVIGSGMRTQCEPGRQRSIEDLYHITKSYIPNVSYEKIVGILKKLDNFVKHGYCHTVHKEVHSPRKLTTTVKQIRTTLGEHNVKNSNYVRFPKSTI